MNGRVGSKEIAGVVGKRGVDGLNDNSEHLMDTCAESEVVLGKHLSALVYALVSMEKEG